MINPVQTYPKVTTYTYPGIPIQNQIPNRAPGVPHFQQPLSGLINPPQVPTVPNYPVLVPPLSGIIVPPKEYPRPIEYPKPPVLSGSISAPGFKPETPNVDTPLAGKVAIPPKKPETKTDTILAGKVALPPKNPTPQVVTQETKA